MNINVLLLAFCQALLTTGNILLVSVTALIGRDLAPSAAMTTLPVAMQFVGLMAATIPASLIMKKIGRKNGFYLGNSIGIGGAVACIIALSGNQFPLFCLGTFLLGIGIGFGTLYRFAAVEVCKPDQKNRAISLVMAGGIIAAIAGPTLAISSQKWVDVPFQGAFIGLLGLYVLALVLLSLIRIPPAPADEHSGPARPIREIMAQPDFITAVVVGMVGYAVMNLLMTATPLAMDRCGYSFGSVVNVIEWHVLGMFVPSFFTGSLVNRFGIKTIIYTGALLLIGCILINLTGTSEWHFFTALLLLGVGWNFMFIPATQMLVGTYKPAEKSKSQAANEFLVFGMVTLSALTSGWLEASLGWFTMNWMMLPVVLWAVAVVYVMGRKAEAQTESRVQV
ncbi:MAG: MFS transporter [Pontibacterium sp.]